jgi:capsular exopolysaccharide synthesis family protein
MTTLPTTSNLRLPRGPGSGGPMMPTQPPMVNVGGGAVQALTPADIWRVIRGNLWLIAAIVVLAIAVGVGIYTYLLKNDPKYRSVGTLVVNRPYRINPTGNRDENAVDDFVLVVEQRTQQQQLLSEALWADVLEKNTVVRDTRWFKSLQEKAARTQVAAVRLAKEDLEDNLRATPVQETKLISLTMDCASPDDAHDIVEAIGNAHIGKLQDQTFDRTRRELEAATQYKDRYTNYARQTKDKMLALMSRTGGTPTEVGRLTIKEMQLSQLIGAQVKARMESAEADGQLDAINNQIKNGKDPAEVEAAVRRDEQVARLQYMLDQADFEIERETINGEQSPATKSKVQARNAARTKLERAMADVRAVSRSQVLDFAQNTAAAAKAEMESIDAQVDRLKDELSGISAARAEYMSLQTEYEDYKTLEREQSERVEVLKNAVRQQVASVSWYGPPTRPDALSSPSLKVILPLSVIAGLALSLGIAFLRELADQSVRSPRDITRVGPMNVLGMVARESDDPELSGVPLHTVISTAPTSLLAEQLRQVRTRLQHAVSLDTTRTILITSPGPGDGKTTIAANLAAGLALNGRRILLVDANFHRPALHKLYNVGNDVGFSNVLESASNLETSVQKTPVANLELLATGPRPANQTELLESPLFTEFIERALEEYDHVIFDGGPLLVVSEAVALAPRVDGVVVVLRAKQSTRGMLSRVKDTLKQIKAEQIGVVLNGVHTWGGGYYGRTIKTYYDYQQNDR